MFYAIVAGKVWSFISSLSNNDDQANIPAIFMLIVLAMPLFMVIIRYRKTQKTKEPKLNAVEVPELIANYLAMAILNDVFEDFDIGKRTFYSIEKESLQYCQKPV